MKIAILGSGSFGCALAQHLYSNKHDIKIWGRNSQSTRELILSRKLPKSLGNAKLHRDIIITTDLAEALKDAEIILLVVPSIAIREVCKDIQPLYKGQPIVIASKGVENNSLKTLDEVVEDEIVNAEIAVLSGPTHAEEIIKGLPTSCVIASVNKKVAQQLQKAFSNKMFRTYSSTDVKGVELGGAIKNIYAIAAGIADGLGYGDNAKAAIITRAIVEASRLCKIFGAKTKTLNGLTGLGDLIVTCSSIHSRNRMCGYYIGQGYSLSEATKKVGMVVEGVNTLYPVYQMARINGLDTPIINAVYKVLMGDIPVKDVAIFLINRELKDE